MPQGRFHSDKSGSRYGMLTLISRTDERQANGSFKYVVKCDCGNSKVVGFSQMTAGRAKSCGCLQLRKGSDSPAYKHGRSRTKEYELEYQMQKSYGIGIKEYDEILNGQNGVCAICSSPPPNNYKKRLNVDHCHTTGKIRGLLCDACNRALGLFKDNQDIMNKAISYLAR